MKKLMVSSFIGSLLMLSAFSASATDVDHGKALHEGKCSGCHGTRMYTRPNRKIHNLQELQARVEFCNNAAKAGFSPQDQADVIQYLNRDFYKFPDIQ